MSDSTPIATETQAEVERRKQRYIAEGRAMLLAEQNQSGHVPSHYVNRCEHCGSIRAWTTVCGCNIEYKDHN